MVALGYDHVIMQGDSEFFTDVLNLPRHIDVRTGRCRIAGWMVVEEATHSIYVSEKNKKS